MGPATSFYGKIIGLHRPSDLGRDLGAGGNVLEIHSNYIIVGPRGEDEVTGHSFTERETQTSVQVISTRIMLQANVRME